MKALREEPDQGKSCIRDSRCCGLAGECEGGMLEWVRNIGNSLVSMLSDAAQDGLQNAARPNSAKSFVRFRHSLAAE